MILVVLRGAKNVLGGIGTGGAGVTALFSLFGCIDWLWEKDGGYAC
jgi:hypothetical protein